MITKVYNAFIKAGVPEKEAQDAAEALSNETTATKSDVENLDKKIIEIAGEIKTAELNLFRRVGNALLPTNL